MEGAELRRSRFRASSAPRRTAAARQTAEALLPVVWSFVTALVSDPQAAAAAVLEGCEQAARRCGVKDRPALRRAVLAAAFRAALRRLPEQPEGAEPGGRGRAVRSAARVLARRGLPAADIAAVLGVPPAAATRILARAEHEPEPHPLPPPDRLAEAAAQALLSAAPPTSARRLLPLVLAAFAALATAAAFIPQSPVSVFRAGVLDAPPEPPAARPDFSLPREPSPTWAPTATPTPSPTPTPAATVAANGAPTATPTERAAPAPAGESERPAGDAPPPPAPTPTAEGAGGGTPTPVVTPTPCAAALGINLPQQQPVIAVGPPNWFAHIYLFDWARCGFRFAANVVAGAGWLLAVPPEGTVEADAMVPLSLVVRPDQLPGTGEGLFTGRVVVDALAAGSYTVDVQVTNVGAPPRITAVEARCLADTRFLEVRVAAADDYGVVSGYARAGRASAPLQPQEDGSWVALLELDDSAPAAGAVGVYDGAGQGAVRQFTLPCSPPAP